MNVSLASENLSADEKSTITLNAIIENNIDDLEVVWSSSDNEVATVANGVVTLLKAGEVTITVSVGDKNASCVIIVNKLDTYIDCNLQVVNLSLLEIADNDNISAIINAAVKAGDRVLDDGVVVLSSSDEDIFTVSGNTVSAKGIGSAKLILTCAEYELVKEIEVNVIRTNAGDFNVTLGAYDNIMITKDVEGYSSQQQLYADIVPYGDGLNISWAVTSGNLTLTNDADARKANISAVVAGSLGGNAVVTLTVEGAAYTFNVSIYVPICQESDLWAMNNGGVIKGNYILLNDIVMENNDPANMGTREGTTYYVKGIIGRAANWNEAANSKYFEGLFDGNGYTISNVRFYMNQHYSGLFSSIAQNGVVKNLSVEVDAWDYGAGFTGIQRWASGAIAGLHKGTIENCKVVTTLAIDPINLDANGNKIGGPYPVGAIVGSQEMWYSSIKNCLSIVKYAKAYKWSPELSKAGTIVGNRANGTVTNCWSLVDPCGYEDYVDTFASNATYGTVTNCGYGYSLAEMKEKGFNASDYNSAVWNFEADSELVCSLVKGCTLAKK